MPQRREARLAEIDNSKKRSALTSRGRDGLGATSGQQVTVAANGPDSAEAAAALIAIFAGAPPVGG